MIRLPVVFAVACCVLLSPLLYAEKATVSPSAWAQTLEALEQQLQSSPLYSDPVRRAEARDYLAKNLAFHIQRDLLVTDPSNPRLVYNPRVWRSQCRHLLLEL